MNIRIFLKLLMMAANRRRKTIIYGTFAVVVIFAVVQVTYFNEAYSPVQVLSDARSEARRLLRFITLYHIQCNNTLQGINLTNWPICMEKNIGVDLYIGGPKTVYSIGPTNDLALEKTLGFNFSANLYIFHHDRIHPEVFTKNNTHLFRTSIVANDPADYGRNSLDAKTQTVNNVIETLRHNKIDILKIESLADLSHSHEVLHYMTKDKILSEKVSQFHLALVVDKVEDDYLYSWYRALYNLFHIEGFRLYHSSSSDPLCLQVTLMESCIYYMSWVKNPGPQAFILYPPALDGSVEFELERLQDYVSDTEGSCSSDLEVSLPGSARVTLCMDQVNEGIKPCQLVVLRDADKGNFITSITNSRCSVVNLEVKVRYQGEITFITKHRRYERSTKQQENVFLEEALKKHMPTSSVNLLYTDITDSFWPLLTKLLDSGALKNISQVILDIHDLYGDNSPLGLRKKFSELKRIEAYGFHKYQIHTVDNDNKLSFHSRLYGADNNGFYRVNYVRSKSKKKR